MHGCRSESAIPYRARKITLFTRRDFLYASVLFLGVRTLARTRRVRLLALVPARASPSLRNGLAFGAEEAARTAALFDVIVTCDVVEHDDRATAGGALAAALGSGADGVVSAIPGSAGAGLLVAAADRGLVVLDVAGAGPLPRPALAAGRRIFHVRPPAAHDPTVAAPDLWHATLHRYGAEQLNERYERRFGAPMDSMAWAGWFAVKALAETLLRQGGGDASGDALATAIARSGFDGHKGQPLSFDAATGVLRQPLYEIGRDVEGRETVIREIRPEPRPRDS